MDAKEMAKTVMHDSFGDAGFDPDAYRVIESVMAKAIEKAVCEERETCARICDEAERRNLHGPEGDNSPERIARSIRARNCFGG